MATRKIILQGNELLTKKSKVVQNFDEKLAELLDDMYETMVINNGIGLACPQVGILKRVVVVDVDGIKLDMVNPEIISRKGEEDGVEGCLSVPNIQGYVKRPTTITVKAFNRYGEEYTLTAHGMLCRCICHEVDHLDGILFTDIMTGIYTPEKNKKKK